jgi:hypothetical protein
VLAHARQHPFQFDASAVCGITGSGQAGVDQQGSTVCTVIFSDPGILEAVFVIDLEVVVIVSPDGFAVCFDAFALCFSLGFLVCPCFGFSV